jgi:beta-mannosidase
MFRSWRVDVSEKLKEKDNELLIVFTSPILKNDSLARNYIKLPGGSDTSEYPVWPYTRKAAYHFGWDFAPRFVTGGIWKDIRLESWDEFVLRSVRYNTESITLDKAVLFVEIQVQGGNPMPLTMTLGDSVYEFSPLKVGKNRRVARFTISNPTLWWPNGSGNPHLYEMKTAFLSGKDTLAQDLQKVGLRTIELVNEPDSIGTSFYFKVNGKPIFMQGANYVPQDVFLPRVQDSQYVHLLKLARDAGMNMLRVWGGGVYEKDIFYDLCDEYGILVWQDFMFAGTMYPRQQEFLENVQTEVKEQIERISKHPCLALWCGNNEIEVAWKNWGWQEQYGYTEFEQDMLWRGYDGLFQIMLPNLVAMLSQNTAYVPTSPQSNWGTPENFLHGSMHYWGVWHGNDDFSGFEKNIGRFMVEWGFQSYPDYDLLAEYISPELLALNSEVMKNRQKSYVGNGKITDFLKQYNFDFTDFKTFAQQSQNLQALGYELALKSHIAAQPHCMGTLLWQLNDCWPGPSWSIINYNGKPKPAYEAVKEVLKR